MSGRSRWPRPWTAPARSRRWPPSSTTWSTPWPIPGAPDEMDELVERFGHVQARFDELGGYALESRAREILAGLGFTPEMMDGDVGALSGGWKMRVALARILLMRPDAMLLDEPSNHLDLESIIWLEEFLRSYEGAILMTSHDKEFMNRVVEKIIEIDGGELTSYAGDYDFYERERADRRPAPAGPVRPAAGHAEEGAGLHRALQGPRQPRRPGAEPGEEARQDREGRAAQGPQDRRLRVPGAPPRSGEDVARLRRRREGLRHPRRSTTGSTSWSGAASAGPSWAPTAPASRRCSR